MVQSFFNTLFFYVVDKNIRDVILVSIFIQWKPFCVLLQPLVYHTVLWFHNYQGDHLSWMTISRINLWQTCHLNCICDSKTNSGGSNVNFSSFPCTQETHSITDLLLTWVTLSGVISLQWQQVILEGFRQVSTAQKVLERTFWSYFAELWQTCGYPFFWLRTCFLPCFGNNMINFVQVKLD